MLPRVLQSGDSLQDWSREIQNYLRSITPKPSGEIAPSGGSGGTTFKLLPGAKNLSEAVPTLSLSSFQLVDASVEGAAQVRVVSGTVAGLTPPGFSGGDVPPYVMSVTDGDIIYAEIYYSDTTGVVSSVDISVGGSLPSASTGYIAVQIGSVAVESSGSVPVVTCSNSRYGPIGFSACRNWFAGSAPYFGVVIS